jgi:hypothetical protein
VIAYKFLRPGGWAPSADCTGLLQADVGRANGSSPRNPCAVARVASTPRVPTLPFWLAEELWVTELEAPILDEGLGLMPTEGLPICPSLF